MCTASSAESTDDTAPATSPTASRRYVLEGAVEIAGTGNLMAIMAQVRGLDDHPFATSPAEFHGERLEFSFSGRLNGNSMSGSLDMLGASASYLCRVPDLGVGAYASQRGSP